MQGRQSNWSGARQTHIRVEPSEISPGARTRSSRNASGGDRLTVVAAAAMGVPPIGLSSSATSRALLFESKPTRVDSVSFSSAI